MLRVYGTKINKQTGEIIKDNAIIFNAIDENNLKTKGLQTAADHGYIITKIIDLGSLANHWTQTIVYKH